MPFLSNKETAFIYEAHEYLENENFLMMATNFAAKPLNWAQSRLSEENKALISKGVEKSLHFALIGAIKTLDSKKSSGDWDSSVKMSKYQQYFHNAATGVTGAVGGFFGNVGMMVELPVTTALMMRNIASIAQEMGHSAEDPEFIFECLYVFSLGSKSDKDDHVDTGYYGSRVAMNTFVRKGAEYLARNSAKVVLENIERQTAPMVLNMIARVASRFEIVVTEKFLTEAVPVVGSLGGATINVAFTNHFGKAARYHFGMKVLEKKYGQETVQTIYNSVKNSKTTSAA